MSDSVIPPFDPNDSNENLKQQFSNTNQVVNKLYSELFTGDKSTNRKGRFIELEHGVHTLMETVDAMQQKIDNSVKISQRVSDMEHDMQDVQKDLRNSEHYLTEKEVSFVRHIYNASSSWKVIMTTAAGLTGILYTIISIVQWLLTMI